MAVAPRDWWNSALLLGLLGRGAVGAECLQEVGGRND